MNLEDKLPTEQLDEPRLTTTEERQLIWSMSNVRDREFPTKLDGDYLIYSVREGNNYLWFSANLYISTQFTEEQRQHMISSARLLRFNFPSQTYDIASIARNDPRDNDNLPFNGRAQPPGRTRMTVAELRDAARRDPRAGEANSMLWAIYCELRSELAESNPGPAKIYIDRIDEPPNGNVWNLGEAEVNYYNSNSNVFRIKINNLAIGSQSAYSNRLDRLTWAATIQHEMLHNLGWNHLGNYETAWMVAYERVTFPGALSLQDLL